MLGKPQVGLGMVLGFSFRFKPLEGIRHVFCTFLTPLMSLDARCATASIIYITMRFMQKKNIQESFFNFSRENHIYHFAIQCPLANETDRHYCGRSLVRLNIASQIDGQSEF